jgi:hypothetical protein
MINFFKSKPNSNPNDFDWGAVTPELFSAEKNTAVHVINHFFKNNLDINRTIRFVKGRLEWYKTQLPAGAKQEVVIDLRGQKIPWAETDRIRKELQPLASKVTYLVVDKPRWRTI